MRNVDILDDDVEREREREINVITNEFKTISNLLHIKSCFID